MSPADGRRVALVTTATYADLDEDLPLIRDALVARGVEAAIADWHDDGFDWTTVDVAVIRSTWDYTDHLGAFLAWADRVAGLTRLANPAPVVRWNADKRYLGDLATAGVPTVATRILAPGDGTAVAGQTVAIVREMAAAAGGTVVVKPVVSAGARDTDMYGPAELAPAAAHADRLLGDGRSVMVQPYLHGIDEVGETGLVFVGDAFSHAFRKAAILSPGTTSRDRDIGEEEITSRVASAAEHAVAEAALDAVAAAVPGWSRRDLLYARVDVAPQDGTPVVMELELVEPSLFCVVDAGAIDRVAGAIAAAAVSPG